MPLHVNGSVYKINGKQIKLYPIARLCAELEFIGYKRTPQSIRKWELHGVTPPAYFKIFRRRLYSLAQIKIFCDTVKECDIKQGYSLAMKDFSEKMWERLQELNSMYEGGIF